MPPTAKQLANRKRALNNLSQGRPQNEGTTPGTFARDIGVDPNRITSNNEIIDPTQREVDLFNKNFGTITSDDLNVNEEPLNVPNQPQERDFRSFADTSLQQILEQFNQPVAEEENRDFLQDEILGSLQTLGTERQRQQELEQQAGLPGQRQELQNVVNQLQGLSKEAAAIPLQIQEDSRGRGRTAGGVEPLQASQLRKNTIKSLGLAAIGQTLQGNISLAESTIQNALEAEFEPERTRLQMLGQLYQFNKDALERVDKKRADQLGIALQERSRVLEIQQNNRKEVYDIAKTAGQFGASVEVMQRIQGARTPEEAIQAASGFLTDPLERQQLQQSLANQKLQAKLTELNIEQKYQEIRLFRQFGGMSPSEYRKALKEERESIEKAETEAEQSKLQAEAIGKKITLLEGLYNPDTGEVAPGLDTVVGPTFFARGGQRSDVNIAGRFLKGVGTVLTLGTGGALLDEATGSADNVVNVTEQFISQEFLQSLIDVKAQGATFGALQKAEQDALTAAATKIGQARIRDGEGENAKVIGYDMSEADFKAEVAKIQKYTNLAYERAIGKSFLPDEEAALDAYEETMNLIDTTTFNPAGYYGI